jgi:hypothetical protein
MLHICSVGLLSMLRRVNLVDMAVMSMLLSNAAARLAASGGFSSDFDKFVDEELGIEFVSTPEELLWALCRGTELIVVQRDLDLRATQVVGKVHCGGLNVTDTVAIQVRLSRGFVRTCLVRDGFNSPAGISRIPAF